MHRDVCGKMSCLALDSSPSCSRCKIANEASYAAALASRPTPEPKESVFQESFRESMKKAGWAATARTWKSLLVLYPGSYEQYKAAWNKALELARQATFMSGNMWARMAALDAKED